MQQRFTYAVTFEFPARAPVMYRGVVDATSAAAAGRRAIVAANKILTPIGWSSMVFVILERAPVPPGGDGRGILEAVAAGEA